MTYTATESHNGEGRELESRIANENHAPWTRTGMATVDWNHTTVDKNKNRNRRSEQEQVLEPQRRTGTTQRWTRARTGIAAADKNNAPWLGMLGHSEGLGDEQKVDCEKQVVACRSKLGILKALYTGSPIPTQRRTVIQANQIRNTISNLPENTPVYNSNRTIGYIPK